MIIGISKVKRKVLLMGRSCPVLYACPFSPVPAAIHASLTHLTVGLLGYYIKKEKHMHIYFSSHPKN